MNYRNVANWKTEIKKRAKEKHISVADLQQRFILEEFASKISDSPYRDSFILKGGFIVSNLLGIDSRTTRDIDMTINSTIYTEQELRVILQKIVNVSNNSFFNYEIHSIKECQVDDGYSGFSIVLYAVRDNTRLSLKLDVSNNTPIYPDAIEHTFRSVFHDEPIGVLSYPVENIIAEKFETTLDRGEFNTRMRDLVDIVLLLDTQKHLLDRDQLSASILEVSRNRNTLQNLHNFDVILEELSTSAVFNKHFDQYRKKAYPNLPLSLSDVFDRFRSIYADLAHYSISSSSPSIDDRIRSAADRASHSSAQKGEKEPIRDR